MTNHLTSKERKLLNDFKTYCEEFDVPHQHLLAVIRDLKVIPMIRGKAFEFYTSDILKQHLPTSKWDVINLNLNAQPGNPDIDVLVKNLINKKMIRIECKLTKNDSFRVNKKEASVRVKCMRSRTFSDNDAAKRMATYYGVTKEQLLIHADNYRRKDFDYVVASLGNSLWKTESTKYAFVGTKEQHDFLKDLFPKHFISFKNFQHEAYSFLLFARSADIDVTSKNKIECKRRKCKGKKTQRNCGFIPNYPIINLNEVAKGKSAWIVLPKIKRSFENFLD